MPENLKTLYRTVSKSGPYNRWVKLAVCFGLVGIGYILFQIAGGFPPWCWRFLFHMLSRLPSLWAMYGLGILFPLIGLLFSSFALLILWSILGISLTLVLLWSGPNPQECFQSTGAEHEHLQLVPDQSGVASEEATQSLLEEPEVTQKLEKLPSEGTRPKCFQSTGAQGLIPDQSSQVASEEATQPLLEEPEVTQKLELFPSEGTRPMGESCQTPTAINEEATLSLAIGIGLDPGLVRRDQPNEDSLFAIQGMHTTEDGPVPTGLFVVADGMGGHANGADASHLAVREISNVIVPRLLCNERDNSSGEQEFFLNLLKSGVHQANLAIYEKNHDMPNMMGTTITTALVIDSTAYIINVGDSRTYLYRASYGLVQITRDHSTVACLVEDGEIEPDEIYTHPQRSQIYRCLGEDAAVAMDTFVVSLQPDDILLLCSDGLWEMVRDPIMEKIITSSPHFPAQISNILVQTALNQGGLDNISVITVLRR